MSCVFCETEDESVSSKRAKGSARKRLSERRSHPTPFIRISCREARPLKSQNRNEVIGVLESNNKTKGNLSDCRYSP